MLKNNQGFTLIESIIALILMSTLSSLFFIQIQQKNMVEETRYHVTNAYHILDNILMEILHDDIYLENDRTLFYNENFVKDEKGIYEVSIDVETGWIKIYLRQSLREVLSYEYQRE